MVPPIEEHLDALRALARTYGVARLEVFGSVCTPAFDPERSDTDVLVDYPPDYDVGPWLGRLEEPEEALAEVLGRRVNLVMISALRDPWFQQEANKTRAIIYVEPVERASVGARLARRPHPGGETGQTNLPSQ
jgi:predicted nucleotidyltransferase